MTLSELTDFIKTDLPITITIFDSGGHSNNLDIQDLYYDDLEEWNNEIDFIEVSPEEIHVNFIKG